MQWKEIMCPTLRICLCWATPAAPNWEDKYIQGKGYIYETLNWQTANQTQAQHLHNVSFWFTWSLQWIVSGKH